MVPVIYGVFYVPIPGLVFAGVNYVGNPSSYMLLAVTVLHIIEIAITPIPFRISHTLPIVAYSLVLCLVASMCSFSFFNKLSAEHCIVITHSPNFSLSLPFVYLFAPAPFLVWRSGNTFSSVVAHMVFVGGCVTGISLTMFNRGIYLLYQQQYVDATDENDSAGWQSSQDKV